MTDPSSVLYEHRTYKVSKIFVWVDEGYVSKDDLYKLLLEIEKIEQRDEKVLKESMKKLPASTK